MEPASSNPPTEPVSPQPQEVPVVPPAVPTQPVNPVEPTPVVPPAPSKGGSSKTLIAVAITVLIIAVLAVLAYFLGFLSLGGQKSPTPTQEAMPIVPATTAPVASASGSPVASPSAEVAGTVTGKLCYPSEMAPAGDIIVKDTKSGKTFTQAFPGTAAGGTLAYTFPLVPGTYHLKYQTSPTMAGYYTACAKDPTSAVCTKDENHVNLDVVVTADKTTANIDLCDFYWNQTQKAALDASF